MNNNKLTDEDLWVKYMLARACDNTTSIAEDGNIADKFVSEFNVRFRSGENNERTE